MIPWNMAISQCANVAQPSAEVAERDIRRCIHCGSRLPSNRTKYCNDKCMRAACNIKRATTRHGRKAKS